MDDLTFLDTLGEPGASNATLKAVLSDGQVCHISDAISPYRFLDACPLLYHAFEYGFQTRMQASIEAPSKSAVISLLRYCYTGNYLAVDADLEPISLLQHAEVYKIASDFDVPELQLLAHGNLLCQTDCACSLPTPPQDWLDTIRFIYQHYSDPESRQQHGLVNILTNFCISIFDYHELGRNAEFQQVVSDIPAFRQDLCRTNIERNFQDNCAFDIIRLPLDSLQAHTSVRPTMLASRDLPEEMLYDIPPDSLHMSPNISSTDARVAVSQQASSSDSDTITESLNLQTSNPPHTTILAHRHKDSLWERKLDYESDSSSDDEGFSLVHRPKEFTHVPPNELLSSPELIPFAPIDVLAATGSNYPSDDEWTMV